MIIPEWLFDERKTFSVRFPYSPANKKFSKIFTRKVKNFTNDKVKVIIIWNTQKIQSLFSNKDKVKHHSCVRWNERNITEPNITRKNKNSDYVKHLNDHFDHEFRWVFLSRASKLQLFKT